MKIMCSNCSKKSLFENKCKCNLNLCLNCLPFYIHNCKFDYKNHNKEQLEKNNPKILAIKVSNI